VFKVDYICRQRNKSYIQKKLSPKNLIAKVIKNIPKLIRLAPRLFLRSGLRILRSNIWMRIISTSVLFLWDLFMLLTKRISGKQFFVNAIITVSMLAGGTSGWYGGVEIARNLLIENVILVFIISFVMSGIFGWLLERLAYKLICNKIPNDVDVVLDLYNKVFKQVCDAVKATHEQRVMYASVIVIDDSLVCSCIKSGFSEDKVHAYIKEKIELMKSV